MNDDPRSYEAALRRQTERPQNTRIAPKDREIVSLGGMPAARVSDHETRYGGEDWIRYPGGFVEYVVASLEESDDVPLAERKARPIQTDPA